MPSTPLNQRILDFGKDVFEKIGREQPSVFNRNFWAGQMMEWSMTRPELKANLFRLVDVLPVIKTRESLAQHIYEYLGKSAFPGGFPAWALRGKPGGVRAGISTFLVKHAVKQMASLFIAGETPATAQRSLKRLRAQKLAFTVDLLGEFCVSEVEAEQYLRRYDEALTVLGQSIPAWEESQPIVPENPGENSPLCMSVKLSALYSQCSVLNFERSVEVLSERLSKIARKAAQAKASLYVDAEDSGNNPVIYSVFKKVFGSEEFRSFPYPGIVVQAYARNSTELVQDLLGFAEERSGPIAIRLVKGAYWDHETIIAAQNNWPSPLFPLKESTDARFEELTRLLMDNSKLCFPAIASHNIRSLSHACCYADKAGLDSRHFELEMLYGMAEPVARAFAGMGYLVRLYVPLGNMIVGMGYLVRRLLENSSNESFLRHAFYEHADMKELLKEPVLRE